MAVPARKDSVAAWTLRRMACEGLHVAWGFAQEAAATQTDWKNR